MSSSHASAADASGEFSAIFEPANANAAVRICWTIEGSGRLCSSHAFSAVFSEREAWQSVRESVRSFRNCSGIIAVSHFGV